MVSDPGQSVGIPREGVLLFISACPGPGLYTPELLNAFSFVGGD